jgi:hypothetical protein
LDENGIASPMFALVRTRGSTACRENGLADEESRGPSSR